MECGAFLIESRALFAECRAVWLMTLDDFHKWELEEVQVFIDIGLFS